MSWNDVGKLDAQSYTERFNRILLESGLSRTTPQQHPKAVILAGQPGAGKRNLVEAAGKEFSGDIVIVDPDKLRDYHPGVDQFRKSEPYTWSNKTHPDASQWAKELCAVAVEGQRNVLVDTTLGNPDSTIKMIKGLPKGYEAEIRVVATHRLESELGVDRRFTESLDEKGYGRYVPEEARTQIYEALPGNLNKVQDETGARIRIYNREGKELYDSHVSPLRPGAALEQAREARMQDPALTRDTAKGWRAQQRWHEDLPENLDRNPDKIPPATAQNALQQRSDLKVVEGVNANTAEAIANDRAVRIEPGSARVRMGLKVAGAAAMAYDTYSSGTEARHLYNQGNTTAAQSSVMHFGTRNLGMIGGATAFATAGAAAGIETGPGAFLTGLAGGVAGAVAGDKIADAIDRHRIYNQSDSDGHAWSMNPDHPEQGWMRRATGHDLQQIQKRQMRGEHVFETLYADPELANRLNYQASNTAIELALPKAPEPKDPYVQPSADNKDATPWMRDTQTRTWSRTVIDNPAYYYAPDQITDFENVMHRETADAAKAAQLDQAARRTVGENLVNSPQGMAQRYQQTYEQNGWSRFGPMPPAVNTALKTPNNVERASDGHTYTRGADGQWTTPGTLYGTNLASAQVRQELSATQAARQRQEHAAPNPAMTAPAQPQAPAQSRPPPHGQATAPALARMTAPADPHEARHTSPPPHAPASAGTHPMDPRDPQHRDHTMYQGVSRQLTKLNHTQGIELNNQQLDNCTAALMADARAARMHSVTSMKFAERNDGQIDRSMVVTFQGDPNNPANKFSTTDMDKAFNTPAEQSFQKFERNTQALDQREQQIRQQPQAERRSQDMPMFQ